MGWEDRRAHRGYSSPTLPLKKEYPLVMQARLKENNKARNTLPTVGWLRVIFFSAQRNKPLCGLPSLRDYFPLFSKRRIEIG